MVNGLDRRVIRSGAVFAAFAFVTLLCACGPSSAQTDAIQIGPDAAVTPARRAEAPLLGVNVRHREDARYLPLAHAAGVDFVRTDIVWEDVEAQPGAFDFSYWDHWIADIEAAGLKTHFVLAYENPHYGDGDIDTPEQIAAFSRFATAAAARYRGRGVIYEIWNEPDVDESTRFHQPADFAALVSAGAAALHAGDRDARVVSGGISWIDFEYLEPMLAYWRDNGTPALTAFGQHPYGAEKPEDLIERFPQQEALLRSYGVNLPIWNTEYGFSSGDAYGARDPDALGPEGRRQQAVMLARHMLTLWIVGLERSVWYEFMDDGEVGHEEFRNYGMLADNGSPKPAYTALATFNQQTQGARLVGALTGLPDGVWGARFEADDRSVVALWVSADDTSFTVRPDAGLVSATRLFGAPISSDSFVLRATDGPVYLTWRR